MEALIHLLGDDDAGIRDVAWNELLRLGGGARAELARAAEISEDAAVRRHCWALIRESQRRDVLEMWGDLSTESEPDLESGAFLIARSEDPEAEVDTVRSTFDQAAAALRRRLETIRSTEGAVDVIAAFVHGELGLRGDRETYYDPDNSFLPRVLERRRGIPISLGTVYLCLAKRLGVALEGVGMPCHFVLKFTVIQGGVRRERFVDPFAEGRILSIRECALLLEEHGVPFHESFLRGIGNREILLRTLGNLLRAHHESGDSVREARVAGMIEVLRRDTGA